jgi:hypothetical protein
MVGISFTVSFSTAAILLIISLLIGGYFIAHEMIFHSFMAAISKKGNACFYK